jgi:thioredoxin 2
MAESDIVVCPHCSAKNRVPAHSDRQTAKCGRCHQPLGPAAGAERTGPRILTLRCSQCRTKNRIPEDKLKDGAKCGRCAAPLHLQDINTGRTVMVTDANFEQTVLNSPLPVLLYGWAPWCSVCGSTGPQVDRLALDTRGRIRVGKLNVETNPQLASRFSIFSVPAFFIFDGGQLKEHLAGAMPVHDLMMKMAAYI